MTDFNVPCISPVLDLKSKAENYNQPRARNIVVDTEAKNNLP